MGNNNQQNSNCKNCYQNAKPIMSLIGMKISMIMAMKNHFICKLSNNTFHLHVHNIHRRWARLDYTIEMYKTATNNSLLSVWQTMFEHTYLVRNVNEWIAWFVRYFSLVLSFFVDHLLCKCKSEICIRIICPLYTFLDIVFCKHLFSIQLTICVGYQFLHSMDDSNMDKKNLPFTAVLLTIVLHCFSAYFTLVDVVHFL